jgi:hypothetical protein
MTDDRLPITCNQTLLKEVFMKKLLIPMALLLLVACAMGFVKTSVAEIISTTWCGPCGTLHAYLDENYPPIYNEAVMLDYVTDIAGDGAMPDLDSLAYYVYSVVYNPTETLYYVPSGGVEGTWGFIGGDQGPNIITHLTDVAGTETHVGIWFTPNTDSTIEVAVTIDDASAAGEYRLFPFILENHIIIPSGTASEYNCTVRALLAGAMKHCILAIPSVLEQIGRQTRLNSRHLSMSHPLMQFSKDATA